jgi:addiction module HigA family antidote
MNVKRRPSTPGEILKQHYLRPRHILISVFAEALGCSRKHLSNIIHGRARVDVTLALRMAALLGTTPQFWLNLQNNYDLYEAERKQRGWKPSGEFTAHPA